MIACFKSEFMILIFLGVEVFVGYHSDKGRFINFLDVPVSWP